MATLADLQNRIITEINRDDLADDLLSALNTAIQDAIGDFANERFWFNETRVTGTLSNGAEYTALPSGMHHIDSLFAIVGGVRFRLRKISMDHMEGLYTVPQVGQPTDWANFGTTARLWPTPNVDYPSIWLTISDVTPTIDWSAPDTTISNNWTNEGQWLISSRAKRQLYRNVIKDYEAAAAAQSDEEDAYANLKGESNRRIMTGRMRPSW